MVYHQLILLLVMICGLTRHAIADIQANVICRASDNNVIGSDLEVYAVALFSDITVAFSCLEEECMQCSWHGLVNVSQQIGNGSLFTWTATNPGYGQYNCIKMDGTVARKILVLPTGSSHNCGNCIQTANCITELNLEYNFTALFDIWILNGSSCELCRDRACVEFQFDKCITIDFSVISTFFIRCPVCNRGININYFIPSVNISSDLQTCTEGRGCIVPFPQATLVSSTAFTSPTQSVIESTEAFPTQTTTMLPTTTNLVTTTNPVTTTMMVPNNTEVATPGGPNDSNSNTGVIVGGVVGGAVLLVLAIIAIIIILYLFYCYVHKNRGECVINKPPTNGASSLPNSVDATPVGTTNGIANSNDVELENTSVSAAHAFNEQGNCTNANTHRQRSQIVSKLLKCDNATLADAITKIHPTIKKCIKFGELLPYFNRYGIFTHDEKEHLTGDKYKSDKVNYLIETLNSKDENGIFNFVKALDDANEHSGHSAILNKLHDEIFVTIEA